MVVVGVVAVKVAVTVRTWDMVTLQLRLPLQAPSHPVKVELAPARAVSVTRVPTAKLLVQSPVQGVTPVGREKETVPVPVPCAS